TLQTYRFSKQTSYSPKQKIVAANKKDSKTHVITSYHIRKALTDLDLLPKFEDGELNITTADRLTLTLNEFQTYIDSKAINILDISGFVLFDASSYAQVVGNDQTKRRNYYAYSNKSNIASIIELTKVLYSDGVNDPINSEVAKGLTKLGFYDEGLEHIKDNVYTPSEKQDGYRTLGKLLLEIDEKTVAAKAFTKEYEIVKQTILSKDGQDESIATSEQNDLSYIIRHLSKTGHFEDNNSLEITGANTVINKLTGYTQYYLEANRYTATSSTPVAKQQVNDYQKITNLIDDLSTDFITYYNDIENARKSYDKNIELGNNFPADPEKKSAQFHLATIAIHGKIFGKDTTTIAEKAFGGIENGALSSSMKNLQVAYNALNTTDMDTVITELGTLSNSYVDDAIQRGAGTALFLNGQKDKLFTDYYGVDTYYSSSNKEKLMQYSTQLQPTNLIPTAMAIKILGTDSDLKDYLDRLRVLADTWYGGDSNISEGDAKKVYGYWSNTNHRNRYGYLAIASMYKDLGENQSAKDTINESIVKLKSFPDSASEKVDGLLNIWDAAKELGYENEIDVVSILDSLETFANTTTDVEDIVKIANILSINKKQTEAKGLLERALNQVNTDNQFVAGDKDNIKDRMKSLIGIYNNSSNFESSIANGYYQVGDKSKAEDIIKQVYETEIKSLGSDRVSYDTATQYDYLVSVVSGYGSLNDVTKLKSVLEKIKTTKEKELAYVYGAKALAEFDQLLGSSVASVDSDGDGKPDFFNLGATEADITASGLEIDDDIDGDGILDTIDTLPYDNVN
ncbi:MAG: hypothetical protein OIF32_08065, partial [Campylobacterales bacterium]|nr:hypothetical protein [Campylobacterales bacterium]